MKLLKITLLAGASMAILATAAQAQVPMPGFYFSGTGWYVLNAGPNDATYGLATDPKISPDDGWGGRVNLGYRFATPWDIGVGVQGAYLSKDKADFSGTGTGDQIKGRYFAVDLEFGYTFADGGFAIRPHAGIRYVNWRHDYNDNVAPVFEAELKRWGIGPRIGADAALRFGTSGFFATGAASGGLQWGKNKSSANAALGTPSSSENGLSYNVEGNIGLGYEFSPGGLNIVLGYRGEKWWKVSSESMFVGGFDRQGDRLMHGPYVRLAYNFGPPIVSAMPAPAVVPEVQANRYMVFFDFDRDVITPQAASTIRDAATAYKAGNRTRIDTTGHADRSGSDAYNMGLGLRRANNVKNELIKNGVPAANIVVVSRGESMPLVQTADGVREPQNRRVEIVLN